jgi:hypothetical protein
MMIKKILAISICFLIITTLVGCTKPIESDVPATETKEPQVVDIAKLQTIEFAVEEHEYRLGMPLKEILATAQIKDKADNYKPIMKKGDRAGIVLSTNGVDFNIVVINNTKSDLKIEDCVIMQASFFKKQISQTERVEFFHSGLTLAHNIDLWKSCVGNCNPKTIANTDDYMWTVDSDAVSLLINIKTEAGKTEIDQVLLTDYKYMQ